MDLQTKYQNLCNWLTQNGSYVNPKMSIRSEGENGNGLFATETIQNEELFKISNNCLLNYENSKIPYDVSEFDNRQMTTISLIYEMKNPVSFWRPYLDLLPSFDSFSNHPIFLTTRNTFPRVSVLINFYLDKAFEDFSIFLNKFREYSTRNNFLIDITEDEILYCYLLTISRMWTGIGLIPIADLLQHSNQSQIALNKEGDYSNMKTVDSITSGHPIYDNYLINDDIMLFINFGFVDNSEIITIPMNFVFDERSILLDKIIKKEIDGLSKIYLTSQGINVNLMKYLRLNFIELSDLELIKDSNNIGDDIISISNEFKALKKLKFRLSNYIPQEDLSLLNRVNYSSISSESNVYRLLNRIFKLKESTFSFIDKYWKELLNN